MTKKEYVLSFLNGVEQAKLQKFADDEDMKAVVMKILLAAVYQNGTLQKGKDPNPRINFALSLLQYADAKGIEITNELLGAQLRACWQGIKLVESALEMFEEFKTPEEPKKRENPAR